MQDTTKPVLKNREAFEHILNDYKVSDHAKQVLAATPFVALSGLAGGGRNTVIRQLVENYDYGFIVSDTTRPPKLRDGKMEEEGVNYYFSRDEQEMLDELSNGEFVEAEVIHNQQVSGTSIREVERIVSLGKIPVSDYEFGGANAIANTKVDAAIIGLLPPSYDEWMRRLSSRETMDDEEFRNRLVTAEKVLENMLSKPYFKFVINRTVEQCAEAIDHIVKNPKDSHDSDEARKVASEIREKVREILKED